MKKQFTIFLILIVTTLLSSCAAQKSKKCNCPTFGDKHKHAQFYQPKENKKPV